MMNLLQEFIVHVSRLLLLLALAATQEYRFDYKFDEVAGGWLKYHIVPTTWENARMICHAEGAVLASPLTQQLKSAIVSLVKNQTVMSYEPGAKIDEPAIFSGVHATYSRGTYASVEGVPLLRLAITWFPGEPDSFNDSEHCLVMIVSDDGAMADARCNDTMPFVCYKKDTMLNLTECGTTDHEYVMDKRTGSCYKLHRRPLVWADAYKTCASEGAYLAIINSDVEVKVIQDIESRVNRNDFNKPMFPPIALGFHDWSYHHNFMTIHGETLDAAGFQNWGENQPKNNSLIDKIGDDGQHCGGVVDDHFCSVYCSAPVVFLCEMIPNNLR